MSGLSFEEQNNWREYVIGTLEENCSAANIKILNPVSFYNDFSKGFDNQREVMEYDLYQLRKSHLVICNFNNPSSIGTSMELMLAYEHKIPIVGLNSGGKELHPWLTEVTSKMFDHIEKLIDYILIYYLW